MYKLNEDLSIYVTRGDAVLLDVKANNKDGTPYTFVPGDLVRFKVCKKKNTSVVVLQKDFTIETATQSVQVYLSKDETKIGTTISKPVDYWYEVELNPLSEPQTIIGYDEDGAKVFKLFPEGADKEVEGHEPNTEEEKLLSRYMDDKLDLSSTRPVENQVIARAIARLEAGYDAVADIVTPQMFGAIGDGETDDTKALQGAIDSGCYVFLPSGTYAVSHLRIPSGVTIKGRGEKSIIKLIGDASQYQYPLDINGAENVTIESICIDGNGANQSQIGYGICIYASENVTIRNCHIKNVFGDGIKVGQDGLLSAKITIENCVVEGSTRNELSLLNCENVRVTNCKFNGGTDSSALVDLELHAQNNHITNVVFSGCTFIQNEGQFIKILSNGFTSTYDSVVFENCSMQTMVFVKQFENVTFKNCVCNGGFDLSDTTDITIRDCLISSKTNGIYAYKNTGTSNNLRVLNCNIEGDNYGILIQNTENALICECLVKNSEVGIGIYNAVIYSVLRDNRIVNNTTGIHFQAGTYRNNLIEGCYLNNETDISGMIEAYTKIDDFTKATYS